MRQFHFNSQATRKKKSHHGIWISLRGCKFNLALYFKFLLFCLHFILCRCLYFSIKVPLFVTDSLQSATFVSLYSFFLQNANSIILFRTPCVKRKYRVYLPQNGPNWENMFLGHLLCVENVEKLLSQVFQDSDPFWLFIKFMKYSCGIGLRLKQKRFEFGDVSI